MIEQLKTIRDAAWVLREHNRLHFGSDHNTIAAADKISAALAELEAAMREPVAWQGVHDRTDLYYKKPPQADVHPLYRAAPPAQQAQPTESVLVDGIAYDTPAPVAAELLRLHLEGMQPQAEAVQACGHSMSLLLRSAESNAPLYCEACDDKSGRHDAERRETELLDANHRLQEKIGSADALKLHAIEELCQLGYTVKDGELFPPDHLHKLMEAAGHPLAAPQQAEAVPCGGREHCGRFPFCGCGDSESLPERDTTKSAEQQGLFRKFVVRRTDGSDAPGGKHDGCDYFVLDVNHDKHAKAALAAYAAVVEETHPQLAADMRVRYGLAAPQQAEAVPPTHVLVPVEPTEAMEMAWDDAHGDGAPFHSMYAAMLAAAKKEAGHE